jgi:hypothetical protein
MNILENKTNLSIGSIVNSDIGKNIYGIYFICCLNNYLDIVREQLTEITNSGLYNNTTQLLLFITLYDENNTQLQKLLQDFDKQNKIKMITTSENLYEKFAISNYKKYISHCNDYYVYYFHTKGISKYSEDNIFSRRRKILDFYILNKYNISIKLLENYDAVGCSLYKYPKLHFSGNFWWSKSSHLNKLNDEIGDGYLAPEMYICSFLDSKYISLNNYTNNGIINDFILLNDTDIMNNVKTTPIENVEHKALLNMC